jgi:hypothetical protein
MIMHFIVVAPCRHHANSIRTDSLQQTEQQDARSQGKIAVLPVREKQNYFIPVTLLWEHLKSIPAK